MREILFRAKRTDTGEWVEGYYFCMVHDDGRHVHHFIMPLGTDLSLGTPIEKIQVEVNPDTICQYTGLTDKNGNKIWENDVIRYFNVPGTKRTTWIVEYSYGGFRVSDNNPDMDERLYIDNDSIEWDVCEVIGNIFDNPELLEV